MADVPLAVTESRNKIRILSLPATKYLLVPIRKLNLKITREDSENEFDPGCAFHCRYC